MLLIHKKDFTVEWYKFTIKYYPPPPVFQKISPPPVLFSFLDLIYCLNYLIFQTFSPTRGRKGGGDLDLDLAWGRGVCAAEVRGGGINIDSIPALDVRK